MSVTKCFESFGKKCYGASKKINRSRVQIMAEILSLCRYPQTRTQVKFHANLSWRMLQKYLSQLRLLRLLEVYRSQTNYVTTKEGLHFVERMADLMDLSLTSRAETIGVGRGS